LRSSSDQTIPVPGCARACFEPPFRAALAGLDPAIPAKSRRLADVRIPAFARPGHDGRRTAAGMPARHQPRRPGASLRQINAFYVKIETQNTG